MSESNLPTQFLSDGSKFIQLPVSPEMADAIIAWRKNNSPALSDSDDGVSLVAGAWWLLVAALIEPVIPHACLDDAISYCRAENIQCQDYLKRQIPAAMGEYLRIQDAARLMKKYGFTIQQKSDVDAVAPPPCPVSNKGTPTISTVIDELILAKRSLRMSDVYIASLRQYLAAFAKGREHLKIDLFESLDIDGWFAGRNEAPGTRNSNLGRLSALFSFAWRKGYITENPCLKVEKLRVERGEPAFFTVEQCRAILEFTEQRESRFLAWLVLCLFVGLRPESEADILTWEEIDIARKRIRIDSSKTKTHRSRIIELTLCPPAVEWLERAKNLRAELPIPHITRRRYLRKLRDVLKLPEWPQDVLRHTAATNLFALHQDAGKVAAFLGNSADILLRHYRGLIYKEEAVPFFEIKPKK